MSTETDATGIYKTQYSAENAVDALKAAGFKKTEVALIFPANSSARKRAPSPPAKPASFYRGIFAGAALGWLATLDLYAVLPLQTSNILWPILVGLMGALAFGALGGGVGLYIGKTYAKDREAQQAEHLAPNSILLSVHCRDLDGLQKAEQIMVRTGAEEISPVLALA